MSDCAIGPDSKLLNAKDIEWYEDTDSSEPINQATTPSSATASSSTAIHPFFHGGLAPAVVVAGAHHSGHVTHPSDRITNPTMLKHCLPLLCTSARSLAAWQQVAVDDKGSTDGGEINDYEPDIAEHPSTTSDDETMGDADCEVNLFLSL
jgi:hypothetical protein